MRAKRLMFLLLCYLSDTSAVLYNNKLDSEYIEIQPLEEANYSNPILVSGIIYRTFKKYYCEVFKDFENRRTLLRGSKAWTFPRQDVNLTLAYPSAEHADLQIEEDYVITGYQVILFTDGLRGTAYIHSGGILEDTISLTFISEGITTLSYQFWLYGTQRSSIPAEEYNYVMC
ncbi:uncharacterized protein LOC133515982 [Cydia pomonella]|uniref:uncharacterized protein LOC133515982 n=1 Tax=Cydia pomonella TaxID=82600 RepID=UPI002ADD4EB6|nr:uncharacterized protein LOC133515982 [Cydia pomonella]